ncbi:MAG: Crp/Fnr family transcriptional regulator [Phenylobacterium sp.]|uniref:Crp/Fnr family transcriptional regulator n=1 Tax=Phenylobacterium sp. TaxID=1871053 RepID=UPI00391C3FDC
MSANDRDRAAEVLGRAAWLRGHDPDLVRALLAHGRLVRLEPGQWAQAEGDEDTGLLVVIEGGVQILCQAPGDREVLVGAGGVGLAIGQTMRFGGGPRLVTVLCAEPSLLLKVSDAALTRIAAERPEIWRAVAALVYLQLRGMLLVAAEAAALPPRQRLAARMLILARAFDQTGAETTLRLGQQALAEMLGLTRKTVNGYLADFQRRGLVRLGYGRIELLDLGGLRRVAES